MNRRKMRREVKRLSWLLVVTRAQSQLDRVAEVVVARTVAMRAEILDAKKRCEASYARQYEAWTGEPPREGAPQSLGGGTRGWMLMGGTAALALDALFATWAMASFTLLPLAMSLILGSVSGVLLAAIAKGCAMLLVRSQAETPHGARRYLDRTTIIVGGTVAILLAIVLLARSAGDGIGAWLVPLFGVGCGLLSIALPLLSAAMLALSSLHSWDVKHAKEWQQLDDLYREVVALSAAAERAQHRDRRLEENGVVSHDDGPRTLFDQRRTRASLGVIVVAFAIAPLAQAQEAAVYVDVSPSVSEQVSKDARQEVVRLAPELSRRLRLKRWSITAFSDDAWSPIPRRVQWPGRSWVACPPLVLTKAEAIIAAAKRRKEERAKAVCDSVRMESAAQYKAAEHAAIGELASALAVPRLAQARCTALADAIERAATTMHSGDVSLILTDGLETCGGSLSRVRAPENATLLFLILIPGSDARSTGNSIAPAARRKAIVRELPWIRVISPADLEDLLLEGPLSATAPKPQ